MNKIIDKSNNSFNMPSCNGTGLNGLHSVSSYMNKGYTLFESDNMTFSFEENNLFVSSNSLIKDYCLDYKVLPQLILFEALQNNLNLDEFLERAMHGKPSLSQTNYKQDTKQKTIVDTTQVLTSKEYLKLNVIEALKDLKDDNVIFTQFLSLLDSDKFDVYQTKINKETELFVKFEELSKLKFTDIKQLKDNRLSLNISLKDSQKGLTESILLGYIVESTTLNHSDMTLNIVMIDKQ